MFLGSCSCPWNSGMGFLISVYHRIYRFSLSALHDPPLDRVDSIFSGSSLYHLLLNMRRHYTILPGWNTVFFFRKSQVVYRNMAKNYRGHWNNCKSGVVCGCSVINPSLHRIFALSKKRSVVV